jgi:hypothetical protein
MNGCPATLLSSRPAMFLLYKWLVTNSMPYRAASLEPSTGTALSLQIARQGLAFAARSSSPPAQAAHMQRLHSASRLARKNGQ